MACVGVNGASKPDFSDGVQHYSYFTAPAGHTFIWRLFTEREEAVDYFKKRHDDDVACLAAIRRSPREQCSKARARPRPQLRRHRTGQRRRTE